MRVQAPCEVADVCVALLLLSPHPRPMRLGLMLGALHAQAQAGAVMPAQASRQACRGLQTLIDYVVLMHPGR